MFFKLVHLKYRYTFEKKFKKINNSHYSAFQTLQIYFMINLAQKIFKVSRCVSIHHSMHIELYI